MGSGTTKVACRFLSTLSSRRATAGLPGRVDGHWDFYPRSPRGERRQQHPQGGKGARDFYPRSPRGERLGHVLQRLNGFNISIHALLAESDFKPAVDFLSAINFYPRSPRGERHRSGPSFTGAHEFLSTLSSRRATCAGVGCSSKSCEFLSTLSSRRATTRKRREKRGNINFYPRSPRGERRITVEAAAVDQEISIHALLAESDWQ